MDTTKDKESIQCYTNEAGDSITETTYEGGFTRLNKTTGEYTEFSR